MPDQQAVVRDATWQPYALALRRPWTSARGTTSERTGWLLRLRDDHGRLGFGDCAPLPGAGTETHDGARQMLEQAAAAMRGKPVTTALESLPTAPSATPAVRCACETALLDLQARAHNLPLHQLLARGSSPGVRVNAMIGAYRDWPELAQRAVDAGFDVLKLKIGTVAPATELTALHSLMAQLPLNIRLRLDVNRGWSLATARSILPALDDSRIEAVEEPASDASGAQLRALQAAVPFAIALDESLHRGGIGALPVRRQVLKPMAVGGLLPIIALAADNEHETVVTTSVDSAIGVRAACHVAAALDNGLAHGLATSDWLHTDFAPPLPIARGLLHLPASAGLGLDPGPVPAPSGSLVTGKAP